MTKTLMQDQDREREDGNENLIKGGVDQDEENR